MYMYVCTCTTNYGMYILHANVQPFPNQKCTCMYMYVCTCTTNYVMYILHANVQPIPNQKCTCICNLPYTVYIHVHVCMYMYN